MRIRTLLVVLGGLLTVSCGGGGGGGPSGKAPMEVNKQTAVWTYQDAPRNRTIESRVVGKVTAFGKEYTRFEAGTGSGDTLEGIRADLNWTPNYVEGVAITVPTFMGIASTGGPVLSAEASAPVRVDLDPPVGVPQPLALSGSVSILGGPVSQVEVSATYTLVSDNETVETPMGTLTGVKLFTGEGSGYGHDVSGSVWYHPVYGIVAAETDLPPPANLQSSIAGLLDPGDPDASTGVIQQVKALSPQNPVFMLDTYSMSGAFDADKNKHAKMLLELRWQDETLAKDPSAKPAVTTEFGTVWGIYPHMLVASPVSFLHPEDNGLGYTFWIAYVNQAAKNESVNGIAYHIQVSGGETLTSPLQVSARIIYERVQ